MLYPASCNKFDSYVIFETYFSNKSEQLLSQNSMNWIVSIAKLCHCGIRSVETLCFANELIQRFVSQSVARVNSGKDGNPVEEEKVASSRLAYNDLKSFLCCMDWNTMCLTAATDSGSKTSTPFPVPYAEKLLHQLLPLLSNPRTNSKHLALVVACIVHLVGPEESDHPVYHCTSPSTTTAVLTCTNVAQLVKVCLSKAVYPTPKPSPARVFAASLHSVECTAPMSYSMDGSCWESVHSRQGLRKLLQLFHASSTYTQSINMPEDQHNNCQKVVVEECRLFVHKWWSRLTDKSRNKDTSSFSIPQIQSVFEVFSDIFYFLPNMFDAYIFACDDVQLKNVTNVDVNASISSLSFLSYFMCLDVYHTACRARLAAVQFGNVLFNRLLKNTQGMNSMKLSSDSFVILSAVISILSSDVNQWVKETNNREEVNVTKSSKAVGKGKILKDVTNITTRQTSYSAKKNNSSSPAKGGATHRPHTPPSSSVASTQRCVAHIQIRALCFEYIPCLRSVLQLIVGSEVSDGSLQLGSGTHLEHLAQNVLNLGENLSTLLPIMSASCFSEYLNASDANNDCANESLKCLFPSQYSDYIGSADLNLTPQQSYNNFHRRVILDILDCFAMMNSWPMMSGVMCNVGEMIKKHACLLEEVDGCVHSTGNEAAFNLRETCQAVYRMSCASASTDGWLSGVKVDLDMELRLKTLLKDTLTHGVDATKANSTALPDSEHIKLAPPKLTQTQQDDMSIFSCATLSESLVLLDDRVSGLVASSHASGNVTVSDDGVDRVDDGSTASQSSVHASPCSTTMNTTIVNTPMSAVAPDTPILSTSDIKWNSQESMCVIEASDSMEGDMLYDFDYHDHLQQPVGSPLVNVSAATTTTRQVNKDPPSLVAQHDEVRAAQMSPAFQQVENDPSSISDHEDTNERDHSMRYDDTNSFGGILVYSPSRNRDVTEELTNSLGIPDAAEICSNINSYTMDNVEFVEHICASPLCESKAILSSRQSHGMLEQDSMAQEGISRFELDAQLDHLKESNLLLLREAQTKELHYSKLKQENISFLEKNGEMEKMLQEAWVKLQLLTQQQVKVEQENSSFKNEYNNQNMLLVQQQHDMVLLRGTVIGQTKSLDVVSKQLQAAQQQERQQKKLHDALRARESELVKAVMELEEQSAVQQKEFAQLLEETQVKFECQREKDLHKYEDLSAAFDDLEMAKDTALSQKEMLEEEKEVLEEEKQRLLSSCDALNGQAIQKDEKILSLEAEVNKFKDIMNYINRISAKEAEQALSQR